MHSVESRQLSDYYSLVGFGGLVLSCSGVRVMAWGGYLGGGGGAVGVLVLHGRGDDDVVERLEVGAREAARDEADGHAHVREAVQRQHTGQRHLRLGAAELREH
jgi:hypothetical protein